MYHSVESWKLNFLLSRVLKGTLNVNNEHLFKAEDCSKTLGKLIKGYPPIQIFVHRGKIHSNYFNMLYTALTKHGAVVIEATKLKTLGGMEILDVEPDEVIIQVTDFMSTTKFLEAVKSLDQKTTHRLFMAATKLYETVFPVIRIDDELGEEDLIEFIDSWFINV